MSEIIDKPFLKKFCGELINYSKYDGLTKLGVKSAMDELVENLTEDQILILNLLFSNHPNL